ncbi:MAG: carbohydrate-binding domain-containing protein, partial [Clostridia bacterium]|nr:carbohydrate-binding domain-containing protein [Clostridia bacterium]
VNNGSITATGGNEGIDAQEITINGGTHYFSSNSYSLYAYMNIYINGGTINVFDSGSGIYSYAYEVFITGGTINIDAIRGITADDRFQISGGNLTVNASKCCIQSDETVFKGGAADLTYTGDVENDDEHGVLTFYWSNEDLIVGYGVKMQASTTANGALTDFVLENLDTYDRIVTSEIPHDLYVGGVLMTDGDYLAVGANATQTTRPEGGYAYLEDGTLYLKNYEYEGRGYNYSSIDYAVIYAEAPLTIEVYGECVLNQTKGSSRCIFIKDDLSIIGDSYDDSTQLELYGYSCIYSNVTGADVYIEDIDVLYFKSEEGDAVNIKGDVTFDDVVGSIYSYELSAVRANNVNIMNHSNVDFYAKCYGVRATETLTINKSRVQARSVDTDDDDIYYALSANKYNFAGTPAGYGANFAFEENDIEEFNINKIRVYDFVEISFTEVYVGGVLMTDGDYLAVSANATQKTKPSAGYAYYKDGVLTLNNYSYNGIGYNDGYYSENGIVYSEFDLTVRLIGKNTLKGSSDEFDIIGIWFSSPYTSYITADSGASLDINVDSNGIYTESGPITINGCNISVTSGSYGILAYDAPITIDNSNISIKSSGTGICSYSFTMTIKNCYLMIDSSDSYGIYSCNTLALFESDISARSKYQCIYADYSLTIYDGYIDLTLNNDDDYYSAIYCDDSISCNTNIYAAVKAGDDLSTITLNDLSENTYDRVIIGNKIKNGWVEEGGYWYYFGSNGYMLKSRWIQSSGKWYYLDANGRMLKNQWMKDSIGWVYCGPDGAMLTNAWCKDSKGWCYVGADGYAVTNCWMKDSIGWIWLDSEGSMTYNKWIYNEGKWYFVDTNGYRVSNRWMKDSKGW